MELGAWEARRDRPWVGWEVRQGEVVSGEQTLYLMVLGAAGGKGAGSVRQGVRNGAGQELTKGLVAEGQ